MHTKIFCSTVITWGSHMDITLFFLENIVACRQGGVSDEPPWQQQDTRPGILWSINRWIELT